METTPSSVRFAALRYRNFTLIWSGLIVSNVGDSRRGLASRFALVLEPEHGRAQKVEKYIREYLPNGFEI